MGVCGGYYLAFPFKGIQWESAVFCFRKGRDIGGPCVYGCMGGLMLFVVDDDEMRRRRAKINKFKIKTRTDLSVTC